MLRLPDEAQHAAPLRWTVLVFVLARVVRAAYLLELQGSELFRTPLGDWQVYDLWAQGLAGLQPHEESAFFMAPLYPFVVSLVYRVAGRDLDVVRSLQAVGGAAAAAIL